MSQTIKLRGNRVAVEKLKKAKTNDQSWLKVPESEEYIGIIKYVGEAASSDLKEGQTVYFGTNCQIVRMAGAELYVMEDNQVYAFISE